MELRAGKFGMADFFDLNDIGSDSHYQFLNWTVDNNGAYDYAADTRGYTVGVIAEYHDQDWELRFGESLMPKVANGPDLVWNLRQARAENFEFEFRPRLVANHATIVRLLSYVNHANMGVYRQAIDNFLQGKTPRPEIRDHPLQTTVKYGFGGQSRTGVAPPLRGFARWGWNEGQHESYAYTEVDETFMSAPTWPGIHGIAPWTKSAAFSSRTGFPPITSTIWRWADLDFCSATAP